jgi:hypothetical protein
VGGIDCLVQQSRMCRLRGASEVESDGKEPDVVDFWKRCFVLKDGERL